MAEKRIALVSGANKGIGFETCRQLGRQGIAVLMGARNPVKGGRAAAQLADEGLAVEFIHLDVTNSEHIQQVKAHVEDNYGKLDILINNAGMVHKEEPFLASSVETVSAQALRDTFDVNFFGAVELTQALLPLLKKSAAGRIVNVSSMLGSLTMHSDPKAGIEQFKPFAYDASKTAMNQFTVHLAAALRGSAIKVNSAHPGWVKTDMGGDEAPLAVEEGAMTSVALATLDADGPTGAFIHMGEELPW